jgi:hypothetical protein
MLLTGIEKALSLDPLEINRRLRRRLSRGEFTALAVCITIVVLSVLIYTKLEVVPNDYFSYLRTAHSDFSENYYPYWIIPVFWLFDQLPLMVGYVIWDVLILLGVFLGARAFGGKAALALLTFQMFYVLFLGQIIGILIGGLGLMWWGLANRRWHVAGLGLILASTKFQSGLALGLLLLLFADLSWRQRLRVLVVPAVVVAISLAMRPSWPLELLATLQGNPPYDWGSISLWRWFGPAALILWLPPLLLPLSRPARFLALASTLALTAPYFQQTDLLALFVFPVGWLPVVLGNLGFLFFHFYWGALQALFVIPLLLYLAVVLPAVLKRVKRADG